VAEEETEPLTAPPAPSSVETAVRGAKWRKREVDMEAKLAAVLRRRVRKRGGARGRREGLEGNDDGEEKERRVERCRWYSLCIRIID
jgi:hypothetical protein